MDEEPVQVRRGCLVFQDVIELKESPAGVVEDPIQDHTDAAAVSARLPAGWGMTTADAAAVSLVSGRQVSVIFGGAEGYEPPAAPQGSGEQPTVETGAVAPMVTVVVQSDEEGKSALDRLYDNSGLLVLAFAGVVVVSSTVLLLVLRRFTR